MRLYTIVRLRDMESVFAESIRRPRLLAQLLGAFAGLALLLGAVGTYGVLSYMVTERRREIGIRIALGAARSNVIGLVMKQGLQPAIAGVVVGLAGALGLNRLIASVLFGVQPTDPATLAVVILTITLVANSPMVSGIGAMITGMGAMTGGKPIRVQRTEFSMNEGELQGGVDGKVMISVGGNAGIEDKTAYLEAMDFDALADF